MATLKQLSIAGFRGYCTSQSFTFGSHATIIGGPNGTGKTSLFDAIEWAVLGNIPRLAGTRDFVRAGDVYRNVFCDSHVKTSVSVTFDTDDGALELRKTMLDHSARLNEQQITIGEAYRLLELPDDDPAGSFLRAHLLEQENIARFVDQRPRDRYDALKSFTTLLRVESVEKDLLETVDRAHEAARAESDTLLHQVEQNRTVLRQLDADTTYLKARLSNEAVVSMDELVAAEGSVIRKAVASKMISLSANSHDSPLTELTEREVVLAEEVKVLRSFLENLTENVGIESRVNDLVDRMKSLRETLTSWEEEVRKLQIRRTELKNEIDGLTQQLEQLQRHRSDLHSLLQGMLRHISKDRCPVCKQEIDEALLKQVIADELGSAPPGLAALRSRIESLETSLESLGSNLKEKAQAEKDLGIQLRALEKEHVSLSQQMSSIQNQRQKVAHVLNTSQFDRESVAAALKNATLQLDSLRSWVTELRSIQARRSLVNESSLLQNKLREAEELRGTIDAVEKRVSALSVGINLLSNAREGTRKAQVELTRKVLSRYAPMTAELILRLRPHKVFQNFGIEVIPAYREGEVFLQAGTEEGITVQVPTVFSMTQRNAVALCLFLALNLSLGAKRMVVIIDDPLHSMDDVNVLGLADLFRQLQGIRQLVFSTHDRRMFDLFCAKLAGSDGDVCGYWFDGWGKSGPQVHFVRPPTRGRPISIEEITKLIVAA